MECDGARIEHSDNSTVMRRVLSASTLSKNYVYNRMGEEVGSIKDIMIDIPTGRVAYAALAVGGFLGIGERLFAIPWRMLTVDEDRRCMVMDVDKRKLENAPGFDKDHWPDMANAEWGGDVHRYWGIDYGVAAGMEYDRDVQRFPRTNVDAKAREARQAVEGPEGPSLREAERIGKSHAKG